MAQSESIMINWSCIGEGEEDKSVALLFDCMVKCSTGDCALCISSHLNELRYVCSVQFERRSSDSLNHLSCSSVRTGASDGRTTSYRYTHLLRWAAAGQTQVRVSPGDFGVVSDSVHRRRRNISQSSGTGRSHMIQLSE